MENSQERSQHKISKWDMVLKYVRNHEDHDKLKILRQTEDLSPGCGDALHGGESRPRPPESFLALGTVWIRRLTDVVGTGGMVQVERKTLKLS